MDAKVIIEFTIKNLCNPEDLEDAKMSFEEMTKYLIKEEGLFGIAEDDFSILKIEEAE
jgi:hypothetical protein